MGGIINIVIGVVFLAGGLSGKLALIGTNSGIPLAIGGVLLILVGGFRIYRSRKLRKEAPPSPPAED